MPDNILDQLKAYQAAQDATRRTVEDITKERNLLKEVASLANAIRLEYNETTKNIGKSIENLEMGYELEEKLRQSAFDRSSLQNNLLSLMKATVVQDQKVVELARINNMSIAQRRQEYRIEAANLVARLRSGEIDRNQHDEARQWAREKYLLTSETYSKEVLSSNRLSKQLVDTRSMLFTEDKRLATLTVQNKFLGIGKKILGEMGPLGSVVSNSFNVAKMNPWVLAAQAATAILEKGYENFKAFDKAAVAVRSNLGVLPGQANQLEKNIKQVGIETMHLGATFDDVAKSINEIANEFTGLVAQDKSLVTTTVSLSKQFGIAEGTSVKFLKTLGGISGNTASSQKSMIGFAQKMAQASGVPLGKIMEDVANASDDVRVYVGSSAVSMIKAATAARMMGIDMNKAAASADKLLQFESSIGSELKASALLGQNVNFNYARQLAFNKDIIGANKEILKITKQVNFNQLNPIQQKAYADAAGKSVSELQDMLTQEKNIQLVKNGTNKEAKKALADYERMMQMKDDEAKNQGKIAEQEILRKANQEKMAQLQNKFNQLMSELAKPVMDVTEDLLDIAITVMPVLVGGFKILVGYASIFSGFKAVSVFFESFNVLITALKGGQGIVASFTGAFRSLGSGFKPIMSFIPTLGKFAKFLAPIMKFAGPIGIVITAIQGLVSLFGTFKSAFKDFGEGKIFAGILKIFTAIPKMLIDITLGTVYDLFQTIMGWFGVDLPEGIWKGIAAVGDYLFDGILSPFKNAWDWLKTTFMGNSPSEIGLSIVKGLVSVSGLILDALTRPFIKGYNMISKFIPGASELKMPSEVLSDMTGDAAKTKNAINAGGDNSLNQAIQAGNQQVAQKLDMLISLMSNGGIAVNLDGQRINAALSTTMLKSGGFGQATTRA